MYAIIKSGGKQYRISAGETFQVEYLPYKIGQEVIFECLLLIDKDGQTKIGSPTLTDVVIKAIIISHGKNDKIKGFKMRRRKHYQKHYGHRQNYTKVRIESINI